jgi:hypothetical protein
MPLGEAQIRVSSRVSELGAHKHKRITAEQTTRNRIGER